MEACYICEERPGTTKDRLFPRNLFPKPLPTDLPTLPACMECQAKLSRNEELFRVFVLGGRPFGTESGRKMWIDRIRPSLRKRTGLRPLLQRLVRPLYVADEQGRITGVTGIMELPPDAMTGIIGKFAKGLYLLNTGQRAAPDAEISFDYAQSDFDNLIGRYRPFFPSARHKCHGGDIACYWWLQAVDSPYATVTYLVFYRWTAFLVVTRPAA